MFLIHVNVSCDCEMPNARQKRFNLFQLIKNDINCGALEWWSVVRLDVIPGRTDVTVDPETM